LESDAAAWHLATIFDRGGTGYIQLTLETIEYTMACSAKDSTPGLELVVKKHVLDDATLLIFRGLVSGLSPASHLLKHFRKNLLKPWLVGFWALALSFGASAAPFAYIGNDATVGVSVVDTANSTVIATIPYAGSRNVAVSQDGKFIYGTVGAAISVISSTTNRVVTTVPVGATAVNIAVSPNGAFVYVTCDNGTGNGYVAVVDTATYQVIATVPMGYGFPSNGLDVTPDGTYVYVSNSQNVSVIATATNTVVATVFVGATATGVAITPDGAFVYVTRFRSDDIMVISTATNTVVAAVRSGGGGPYVDRSGPEAIAVTPNGAFVYVANFSSNNITVIETATNTVVKVFPSGGIGPTGVGVTPDGAFLYVTNNGDVATPNTQNDTISVFETSTHAFVSTIKVGGRPRAWGRFIAPVLALLPAAGTVLAVEGGTFTLKATTFVRYGTGVRWIEKRLLGAATCSNAFFVTDPVPGTVKSCVVGTTASPLLPAGAFLATEGGTFGLRTELLVRFGADTRWVEKTLSGTLPCTSAYFGGTDPAPGILKSCVLGRAPLATGTMLAIEGATFSTASAPTVVKYGAGARWVQKTIIGTAICNNATFGGTDPAPYIEKSCVVR
jgi:YVTN family beta-propeller protein